jgi:methylisocitrate lyase
MEGKQVIPQEEMVAKVKAAVDARVDADLIIMARTDALAVEGLSRAIERANLYRQAGADLIFVEAPQTIEDMRSITSQIDSPTLANNLEGGKTPLLKAQELQEIGYSVVVFPVAATYAVARGVQGLMEEIHRTGTSEGYLDQMITFPDFNRMIGLEELRAAEKKYYQ